MERGALLDGRFEVEERAGSGGMGQVFRCRDVTTGAPAAVKVLLGAADSHQARFKLEARALAGLSHPCIVRYVAHGATASGEPYLAMEWLDGEDLSERLRRGALGVGESIEVTLRVAEALGAAHARGVVHRDLKPSNIFLTGGRIDGAKLLDFGIARWSGATRVTRTGTVVGTPGYMAPEQVRGDHDVDARADVFSLGCVLFECLTGRAAFAAEQLMVLFAKVLLAEAPRLRGARPEAPEALENLLSQMLAKDPDARPAHGAAVAEALLSLKAQGEAAFAAERPPVLTRGEQRTISVVLVAADRDDGGTVEIIDDDRTLVGPEADSEVALRRGVRAWGGRLEHLRDGSMAVSIGGAGLATDQAAQAARCALWLREHTGCRPMALATGRGDTTGGSGAGEAIDRAARMLASWSQGIALDEMTARLLDGRFDVREGGEALTLHGERALAEGTRTLLGRVTPCVGRDLELRALEQLLEECLDESVPCAALVTAPPGAGKSRLAQELLRALPARGSPASVWIGRGDPLRAGSAFGLLSQILRAACAIHDGEPLDVQRGKIAARVAERMGANGEPNLAEFLGEAAFVPFPDRDLLPLQAARRDAQLMHDRMRSAFLAFLRAECAAHPVLLVLEDLHWGDRPTVQFLDHALRELAESPLFVLALARPEVHDLFPKLWAGRRIQEIQLKQLARKACERLARHVLGEGAGSDTVDRVVRLAEGNAFYLEELIRATAEGRGGDLPETMVAMVQSRLGALDDRARRVLRAASVFGGVFWSGAVACLLGAGGAAAEISDLVAREIVLPRRESRFAGEDEYAFRHALLREGAYAMLTDEDRRLGHRLAGGWLEERGEQDAVALAEHFERGGEEARAGTQYLRAAEQAHRGSDSSAVITRAKRGLACRIPDELRCRLMGLVCETGHYNAEYLGDAFPYADTLLCTAERGSAPWAQGLLIKQLCCFIMGDLDGLTSLCEALRQTWPAAEAAFSWTQSAGTGALFLSFLGRSRDGDHLMEQAAAVERAFGDHDLQIRASFHLGRSMKCFFYMEWEPSEAIEHAEIVIEASRRMGHARFLAVGQVFIATYRWGLGAHDEAERLFGDVALPDDELGIASSIRPLVLTWLLVERGELGEARRRAQGLIESGRSRRLPFDQGRGHWSLADVLLRAGELEAAEVEIQTALGILRMASRIDVPGALTTLAALRLAQGRAGEALAAAREALDTYRSMGGFSFRAAFMRLIHAECLESSGDHAAAVLAITEARARVLANADKIRDPAYRRSFLEGVPENRRTLELAREWSGEAPRSPT
jgi:tetratricopeptide (TPR) repeat protein